MEVRKAFVAIVFVTIACDFWRIQAGPWDKLFQSVKDITSDMASSRSEAPPTSSSQPQLLDSFNISHCLHNQGHQSVAVRSKPLVLSLQETSVATNSSFSCTVSLIAAEDKVFYVSHFGLTSAWSTCSIRNKWNIEGKDHFFLWGANDCFTGKKRYISSTNTLNIKIKANQPPILTFFIVQTVGKVLETGNISATMGFIQTPAFDSGLIYPPGMDSLVKLSIPTNHVTLVSFLYIFTSKFRTRRCPVSLTKMVTYLIQLYKEGSTAKDVVWKVCWNSKVPLPEVHDARVLFLRFSTGRPKVYFGSTFKLLYSFHERSHQPCRGNNSQWNCSVPNWPKFQRHFRCNLVRECDGGEDEAQCSYTGHCGQGHWTVGDRCYTYHISNGKHSWRDSNFECRQRGGYLVSLNTPGEWQAVVDVLKMRRSPTRIFLGLFDTPSVFPIMYKHTHMWEDRTVAYFMKSRQLTKICTTLEGSDHTISQSIDCDKKITYVDFLCEWEDRRSVDQGNENSAKKRKMSADKQSLIHVSVPGNDSILVPTVTCPTGHRTHAFQACDEQSSCWLHRRHGYDRSEVWKWGDSSRALCPAPMASLPAMFVCTSGLQRVPYSVVCDHRQHCADNSDERFCIFPSCSGAAVFQCSSSRQCVPIAFLCNGQGDCEDDADETHCHFIIASTFSTPPPPAVIYFIPLSSDGRYLHYPEIKAQHMSSTQTSSNRSQCPETHFQCPDNGYCLPVFVRCNDVNDCPGLEDEAGCDRVSCPGLYRCRSSRICLHPSHVCDGVYQCPQHDDELFCRLKCPAGCRCHGLNFICGQPVRVEQNSEVRYLDATSSGMMLSFFRENVMLIHLSLSRCSLDNLHYTVFPNLRSLDLSHNQLHTVSADHLHGMLNLQFISLSNNPLKSLFVPDVENRSFPALRWLDLSAVKLNMLNVRTFSLFPDLQTLNLSYCGVKVIRGEGFHATSKLRGLDLIGCPMTEFPRDLLTGLDQLQFVHADNFKLCCPVILPAGFNQENCRAPFDEVSSCDSLLRSDIYRIFLSVFSSLASLGNLSCFLLRSFILKSSASGFGVFVHHLSISDFLMGVYMAIIGVADHMYKGSYLWEDISWRQSAACRAAGFLSLMSNEVSALVICLITIDRFLVLQFPFSSLHFNVRSAHVTCIVVWVVVMAMAVFPLTPMTSRWSFYSQTGICIPLPVTRNDFAGHEYAFGLLIVFNFILFLLIAAGQAAIYVSVRANSLSRADSTKKSTDLRIARRLISVAVSDFLCWFPIGLLGLMASRGTAIPGEANVGIAVLVLPLNSALNPFLYTINVVLERRMKVRDVQLLKQLMAYTQKEEH